MNFGHERQSTVTLTDTRNDIGTTDKQESMPKDTSNDSEISLLQSNIENLSNDKEVIPDKRGKTYQ